MDSLFYNLMVVLSVIGLTRGLNLAKVLPVPWVDSEGCGVNDPYYQDANLTLPTICDPDGILPSLHRMITSDLLTNCQQDSSDDTKFLLYLAKGIKVSGNMNRRSKNLSAVDSLTQKSVASFNLTQEPSAIFLMVSMEPFKIGVWVTDSLSSLFGSSEREEITHNVTMDFQTEGHFPSAVNKLVVFFCEGVRAPPYRPSKWDALTFLWMVVVIGLVTAVTATVIHLIMVRYKATHGGRPNLGPLSMEMDDFGSTPFKPSGNLLLSSPDVAAMGPQQHSSTANLLDS